MRWHHEHPRTAWPIAVAVAIEEGFVARGFSGMIDHLSGLIQQAIAHPGFALIDSTFKIYCASQ